MLRLTDEPRATDFVLASEYEASTPAAFGLPEVPVLYARFDAQHRDKVAHVWVASDGVYVWSAASGFIADVETADLVDQRLHLGGETLYLDVSTAQEVAHALNRALAFIEEVGAQEDDVEIAVPLDYESGQADDLGEAQLQHSIGMGLSLKSGPAVAAKRRRPS